jgi:hypothetical protein
MYEDYLREDPRDDVRIRISDYTLRIGPGDIERSVAESGADHVICVMHSMPVRR